MVRFLECGCCGFYHKEDYEGDCRNDNERHNLEDLEFFSATDDFEIVSLEQQQEEVKMDEKERGKKIYWHLHLVGVYNLAPVAMVPYFGKAPCECCKSELAGDRYEFTGTVGKKPTDEVITVTCCVDCYMYLFT